MQAIQALKALGTATSHGAPHGLHWLARRERNNLHLFAVNDSDGEGTIPFGLPLPPRSIRAVGEDRSVRVDGAAFQGSFQRLAVHHYELQLPPQ